MGGRLTVQIHATLTFWAMLMHHARILDSSNAFHALILSNDDAHARVLDTRRHDSLTRVTVSSALRSCASPVAVGKWYRRRGTTCPQHNQLVAHKATWLPCHKSTCKLQRLHDYILRSLQRYMLGKHSSTAWWPIRGTRIQMLRGSEFDACHTVIPIACYIDAGSKVWQFP